MNAELGHHPRGAGRVGGAFAPARARRPGRRAARRARSCPVEVPQRKGDPVVVAARRGHPRRHHRRVARRAAAGVHAEDGTITAGNASQISDGAAAVVVMTPRSAPSAGPGAARRDRGPRHVRRPLRRPAHGPGDRHAERAEEGRPGRPRPRAARDQRGLRRGAAERGADAGRRRGHRERERRRRGAGSPDRRERRAAGAHPRATRCGGAAWSSAAPPSAAAAARATR